METAIEAEIDAQYRVLREAAGVLERPDRRSLWVSGPEAADYLQGQLTNDVEALAAGEGCYSALLDRKGHLQGDMRVLRLEDGLRIDTEAIAGDAVLRHLAMYKVGRDVEVEEATGELTVISVIGPSGEQVALGGPAGPENSHRTATLGGAECIAVSTDLGVDLLVARDAAGAVWRRSPRRAPSPSARPRRRSPAWRPAGRASGTR